MSLGPLVKVLVGIWPDKSKKDISALLQSGEWEGHDMPKAVRQMISGVLPALNRRDRIMSTPSKPVEKKAAEEKDQADAKVTAKKKKKPVKKKPATKKKKVVAKKEGEENG